MGAWEIRPFHRYRVLGGRGKKGGGESRGKKKKKKRRTVIDDAWPLENTIWSNETGRGGGGGQTTTQELWS